MWFSWCILPRKISLGKSSRATANAGLVIQLKIYIRTNRNIQQFEKVDGSQTGILTCEPRIRARGYAQGLWVCPGTIGLPEELELRHNNIFQGVFLIIYLLIVEIVMRALIWDSLGTLTGIILSRLYIYLP